MSTVSTEQQPLLIGGEWVPATGGRTFEKADPFTGAPVTQAAAATPDDAVRAVEAAQAAFPGWAGDAARRSGARCSSARPTCSTSVRPRSRRR